MPDATALNATATVLSDAPRGSNAEACAWSGGLTTDTPIGGPDWDRGIAALIQTLSDVRARGAHPMAPVIAYLCLKARRYDAADPDWPDADRLLACGPEGASVLAAVARLLDPEGAAPEPVSDGGVPRGGQGVAMAAGMAWAERAMAARFGRSLADHRTWALTTGEELATGLALEAAHLATEAGLGKLTLVAGLPEDGSVARGYAALGFAVRVADAGDPVAVAAAFAAAQRSRRSSLLLFAPAPVTLAAARDVHEGMDFWAQAAARGAAARRAWRKRLTAHAHRAGYERAVHGGGADCGECGPDTLARIAASPDVALVASAIACRSLEASAVSARGPAAVSVANGVALHRGFASVSACLPHEAEAALPALRLAAAQALRVCHLVLPGVDRTAVASLLATVPGLAVEAPDASDFGPRLARTVRRPLGPTVVLVPEH